MRLYSIPACPSERRDQWLQKKAPWRKGKRASPRTRDHILSHTFFLTHIFFCSLSFSFHPPSLSSIQACFALRHMQHRLYVHSRYRCMMLLPKYAGSFDFLCIHVGCVRENKAGEGGDWNTFLLKWPQTVAEKIRQHVSALWQAHCGLVRHLI